MDGFTFWELTLSGIIVSWPGIAVSVWLGVRHVKRHVDRQTAEQTTQIVGLTRRQTGAIRDLTDDQTRLLVARRWWRRRA